MAQRSFASGSPQPLSVGNVVSATVQLYRSHLSRYLSLSLRAYLWTLVPVYGWAKFAMLSGTISRLAYQELVDQPEATRDALRFTKPRLWNFFVTSLLLGLIWVGCYVGFIIAALIVAVVIGVIVAIAGIGGAAIAGIIGGLVGILAFIAGIVGFIRIFSRLMIAEVPLAIESGLDGASTIGRSWKLTQKAVGRIQVIVLVAFLVTLVLMLPVQVLSFWLQFTMPGADSPNNSAYWLVFGLSLLLGMGAGMLLMPFWQALKAVIYYDLRARQEGLDLQLRRRD